MFRRNALKQSLVQALLFLLLTVGLRAGTAPPPQPLFTDNLTATGTAALVTPLEQTLLNHLNAAQSSIAITLYDFNRPGVRDALIAAQNRGITVRAVADDDAFANPGYRPNFDALTQAGIPLVLDNRSSIMHNKFAVFDRRTVWTGSTNFSNNGFTLNQNNALVITSTVLAEIYGVEFDEMFAGNFGLSKTDNTTHTLTLDGTPAEIYFSPTDAAMNAVLAAVGTATDSIQFSIFFFTDNALRDALLARQKAGVSVSGVWDALGASNAYSEDEALCGAGIPIKIENLPGKMHNKFMVIDADGADPVVITGSMNWTGSGDHRNDENTLIIHRADVAQAYRDNFLRLYNALGPETLCIRTRVFLPLVVNGANASAVMP